jgi:hypothetical protein
MSKLFTEGKIALITAEGFSHVAPRIGGKVWYSE